MTKKLSITILSLLCIAIGGSLFAQPGGFGKGDHSGPRDGAMRLQMLAIALDLTDDQITLAQDLSAEFRTANGGSMQQRHELHQQLRDSLESGSTDACAIGQQMLQIRQAGETAKSAREDFRSNLAAILTPEQKEKFDALEAARGPMHDDRGGRRFHSLRGGAPGGGR
jgi:Spy/CpxP family protein refolding chaperone